MLRKTLITLTVFLLVGIGVFAAGLVADTSVGLPQAITADSPCPATGCANGSCHGFDAVPLPDAASEMVCPEATCASTACHAWDSLTTRYYQPSDASLNLWILAPVALIIGLIVLVKKM